MSKPSRLLAVLAGLVVVGGATAAIAQTDQRSPARPLATAAQDRSTREHFAAFQNDKLAVRDPATLVAKVAPVARNLDPSLVRLVREDADHKIYILAGPSTICKVVIEATGTGGASCAVSAPELATAAAGKRGAGISWIKGGYRVTSLLPDGSRDAAIEMPDGSSRAASIENNMVSVKLKDAPAAFTWVAPDGSSQRYEFINLDL